MTRSTYVTKRRPIAFRPACLERRTCNSFKRHCKLFQKFRRYFHIVIDGIVLDACVRSALFIKLFELVRLTSPKASSHLVEFDSRLEIFRPESCSIMSAGLYLPEPRVNTRGVNACGRDFPNEFSRGYIQNDYLVCSVALILR